MSDATYDRGWFAGFHGLPVLHPGEDYARGHSAGADEWDAHIKHEEQAA